MQFSNMKGFLFLVTMPAADSKVKQRQRKGGEGDYILDLL